jgi:UDP-glucose 4-epimerase
MNVLITGGTGFIGSYITTVLIEKGHQLTILARDPDKVAGFINKDQIIFVKGSLSDQEAIRHAVKGQDACIHVAVNYSEKQGDDVLLDDTYPTVFLAREARDAGLTHFIYTSSTAVNDLYYMDEAYKRVREPFVIDTHLPPCPVTFYGATKAASENYLSALSHQGSMRVNSIRPGYTFGNPVCEGASSQPDTRFADIVRAAIANKPIQLIKNDGTQFIWAGDLAKVYLHVLESSFNRRTFFALSKKFIGWEDIAREAVRRTGSQSRILMEDRGWNQSPYWATDEVEHILGDTTDPWPQIIAHLDYYIDFINRKSLR